MAQTLHSLLRAIGLEVPSGLADPFIEKVTCDSRCVGKGTLFLGVPGATYDGGRFWHQAFSCGAVAAVIGPEAAKVQPPGFKDVVVVVPEPVAKYVGELISAFWGRPSSKMALIGVTGTNGKTTITHLIEYLTNSVGKQAALFGTLFNRWPAYQKESTHTTDFADILQENLFNALQAGTQIGAMEVSSHSLAQHRVSGCEFTHAVFTNLTQDHLDYHHSMEEYFQAKKKLFQSPLLQSGETKAIVNIDDKWGDSLAKFLGKKCWRSSLRKVNGGFDHAELFVNQLEITPRGLQGRLHTPVGEGSFTSPLIGRFNVMNLLQSVGVLVQQGLPLQELLESIIDFPGVPGRMEWIKNKFLDDTISSPTVIVDYAHTPDGLLNALLALRPYAKRKLICVFGCGGDRDRTKREQMGRVAAKYSNQVFLTSDNPRTEDSDQILNDILKGVPQGTKLIIENERSKAIKMAIDGASAFDLVLIAGKGHENYQIIGDKKIDFNDREFALEALKEKKEL